MVYDQRELAQRMSTGRVRNLFRLSPRLRGMLTGKQDDEANFFLRLKHMRIGFGWATSVSTLSNVSVRNLFLDEVDKYESTNRQEAGPVSLAYKRVRAYRDTSKIMLSSSPTTVEGEIWLAYLRAQVRFEFAVRCPDCGQYHVMRFSHASGKGCVVWPEGMASQDVFSGKAARYVCPCGSVWDDFKRDRAVLGGRWQEAESGLDIATWFARHRPRSVAFRFSALVSPFVGLSETASRFITAAEDLKVGKLDAYKDFMNGYLGEPWQEDYSPRKEEAILALRDERPSGVLPATEKVAALLAAVDTQDFGFWYEIRAFGYRCQQDLTMFREVTGNKRIPPESFCRARYEDAGEEIGDFYRNLLVESVENPTCLYPVFPELRDWVEQVEREYREQNKKKGCSCESCSGEPELPRIQKLPLSVTIMVTERCNLACEYCYERFSGNLKPKTMSHAVVYQDVQKYLNRETLSLHPEIQWELIGGEFFVEFELLKYVVDTILAGYKRLNVCPKKIRISLCTNGTNFTPAVREWLTWLKGRIGFLDVGLSLDGIKECHDLCRNKSFDRVMESFDWWKETFPQSGIKGTISPATLKYLSQNVRFYVEELGLPHFYINPTFEGPWDADDAELYGEELIKCAEFFLERQSYNMLENSNLFMPLHIRMEGPRKQNWCGCGTHMLAVNPDGVIHPCLRAVTSNISPLGTLATGVDREKLIPFFCHAAQRRARMPDLRCRAVVSLLRHAVDRRHGRRLFPQQKALHHDKGALSGIALVL